MPSASRALTSAIVATSQQKNDSSNEFLLLLGSTPAQYIMLEGLHSRTAEPGEHYYSCMIIDTLRSKVGAEKHRNMDFCVPCCIMAVQAADNRCWGVCAQR